MKTLISTVEGGSYSLESELTIAVVSMMARLRLKEIALYAGERRHIGTFRFRKNRIWFQPALTSSVPEEPFGRINTIQPSKSLMFGGGVSTSLRE